MLCRGYVMGLARGIMTTFLAVDSRVQSKNQGRCPSLVQGGIAKMPYTQRLERAPKLHNTIRIKLKKVYRLGHTCAGTVSSLTFYFAVPKGEEGIHMLYDGTKSGLNDMMWAPWFPLPTIEAHL